MMKATRSDARKALNSLQDLMETKKIPKVPMIIDGNDDAGFHVVIRLSNSQHKIEEKFPVLVEGINISFEYLSD